ncbi:hypothetical protein C4K37_3687 [Pseudomonas chlororaphis subsp. piscium]|nr:hypothetical protein C4K37_3687 [Pseudomonas chlororaphis subsp. piscium]AZC44618.1 hypothetical protein C4K36_3695 [Pseudomonas chlororaphis subsp. piscium]AZC76559.1 hypothetical protein C4K31_3658 [Pseudomonas chlororaphis subsp. piscium]
MADTPKPDGSFSLCGRGRGRRRSSDRKKDLGGPFFVSPRGRQQAVVERFA